MRLTIAKKEIRKMETRDNNVKVCPICNKEYKARPAISRIDNLTPICPSCGTRQALDSLGISKEEQDKIFNSIHDACLNK